jgi:hypothetical protein
MKDNIPAVLMRWTGVGFAEADCQTTKKSAQRFIKGPLPLPWMQKAMMLPGKSTQVALALWYLAGLTQSLQVKLSPSVVRSFGVSRDAQYDAIVRLERASLITVKRTPGRALMVTILPVE